jgi:hypothetical protein
MNCFRNQFFENKTKGIKTTVYKERVDNGTKDEFFFDATCTLCDIQKIGLQRADGAVGDDKQFIAALFV